MAASTEVIREYLTKIGYVTDAVSQKRAETGMVGMRKKVLAVGGAVAGLVASVAAATAAFAYSMRKMYYQSELSNSSVKNLKGMSYAFDQIGGDGEQLENVVQNLAQILRMNPGMKALAESLGVKVTGRDTSDVAMDLVKAMGKMEHFAGAKFAEQFGIDEKTFYMLKKHMGEISTKRKEMRGIYGDVGFDPDSPKNKKALADLAAHMDRLEARATLVGQKFLTALAPAMNSFMNEVGEGLNRFSKIIQGFMEGRGWETWLNAQKAAFERAFGGEDETPSKAAILPTLLKETSKPKEIVAGETRQTLIEAGLGWMTTDNPNRPETLADKLKRTFGPTASTVDKIPARPTLGSSAANTPAFGSAVLGTSPSSNMTINQTNNVNITGVDNPREVGREVNAVISKPPFNTRNGRGAYP